MSRGVVVAVLLLVIPAVAGVVAVPAAGSTPPAASVQQANNTTTTATPTPSAGGSWSPPGPYPLDALQRSGAHPADAPPSVRLVGSPEPAGSVAVRFRPVSPLQSETKFLESGQRLQSDRIQVYSSVFGEAAGQYQLVIVYWTQQEADTASGPQPYAGDQTVQRVDVTLEPGYQTVPVKLRSHYGEPVQVTMWLERGGERVPGAQWRFEHRSNPLTQSIGIDSRGDAFLFAGRVAFLPGIAGIVLGLSAARLTLRRASRGPGYGLVAWLFVGAIGGLIGVSAFVYEISVVLRHVDVLLGLSLGVVAYGGGLRLGEPEETVAFVRKELRDAVALRDDGSEAHHAPAPADGGEQETVELQRDEYHDELYEDVHLLPTVRGGGRRLIPVTGIRPFFARLFASAAELDVSHLRTRVQVNEGKIDEKIYLDPDSDLEHEPARLEFKLPGLSRLGDDTTGVERIRRVAIGGVALALPVLGWWAASTAAGIGLIGGVVGLLALAVWGYRPQDGYIQFTPAPRHDLKADASLTVLQREHADGQTLEEMEEIAWTERQRTAKEARDLEARRDATMSRLWAESELNLDLDDDVAQEERFTDPKRPTDDSAVAADGGESDE